MVGASSPITIGPRPPLPPVTVFSVNSSSWLTRLLGVAAIGAIVWLDALMFRRGSWLALPFAIIAAIATLLVTSSVARSRRDAALERARRREAAFWRTTFPHGVKREHGAIADMPGD